jgi:pimeloyl-ACP methyl ester carboxylesterase
MRTAIFAGAVCALALLTPAFPATPDGGAFTVEKLGEQGSPLIFIPGLASGTWTWQADATRLAGSHVVYLLSLPGFDGRAAIPGTTFASLQSDLQKLIEKQHLRRPVLIGHSLGGTLSLAFAADHSDLIAGVVAVDGLPVFPGTENVPDRAPLAQGARAQLENQTPDQFAQYQQMYMARFGVIDAARALELAQWSSRSEPHTVAEFAAQLLLLDLRPKLKSISVAVTEISPFYAPDFAAMGVDEAGKTSYYRMLLAGIEQLDVVSISPARHFVMFDQPQKFSAALDEALAKVYESAHSKAAK